MVCPVFRADGREVLTARGKMHLLTTELVEKPSAVFEDRFSRCLLCGACEQVCPVTIEHVPRIIAMRQGQTLMAEAYPKELNVAP